MVIRLAVLAIAALFIAGSADAKERYFPVKPLDSDQPLDDFNVVWYSKHLAALEEPSLSSGDIKNETYRVLWLRTFHAPMSFRLTIMPDGTSELITKKTSGFGGYEPGELVINKTTEINKRETEILIETLGRTRFWDLSSTESGMGLDGAQWVVEGAKAGKYHVVDRWDGGSVMGWSLLLMNKSGEDLQPIY